MLSKIKLGRKGVFNIDAIKKVAVFLMMIGVEKGQSIIALMDNGEIRAVVTAFRSVSSLSPKDQKSVWAEFEELGYEDKLKPSEVITIIRSLFNGSKISTKI